MKKIYFLYFIILLFASCATRINYLGNTYAPTSNVDIFVTEDAIKKNYDVVGKGFVKYAYYTDFNGKAEKIQRLVVEKAKKKGVDAVLITEYFVPNTGTSINTISRSDSIAKGMITIGNTQIQSTGTGGISIQFLKYSQNDLGKRK